MDPFNYVILTVYNINSGRTDFNSFTKATLAVKFTVLCTLFRHVVFSMKIFGVRL